MLSALHQAKAYLKNIGAFVTFKLIIILILFFNYSLNYSPNYFIINFKINYVSYFSLKPNQ